MLRHVAAFEIRDQLRQPLFWGIAGVFAMMSFVATVTDTLQIGGAIGSVHRNAPYVVVRMLGDLSLLAVFMVVAFAATSVLRDFERGTDGIVFASPVRPRDLLLGRYVGSLVAACLCFLAAPVGLLVGGLMPWLEPERVGPFSPTPYLYGLAAFAWPTFAIVGAVFFAVASRVRNLAATFASLVVLLVGYFAAMAMWDDLESRSAAALLDPFGFSAFMLETQYWTVAEKNSRIPGFTGVLLGNRLLWIAVAMGALAWAVGTFRYERLARSRSPAPSTDRRATEPLARLRRQPVFTRSTALGQLRTAFRLEARLLLRSVPFLLILAFGLINVLANMGYLDVVMGTPVWPVTHLMLTAIRAGYSFLLVLILTYYAGEVVWRERRLAVDGILDALPVSTWVPLTAKVGALCAAVVVFIGAGMVGLMGFQLAQGYTRLEPGLYAQGLIVEAVPFVLMAVLAVFLQVAVNQRYVGYLLMVLFVAGGALLDALGLEHHLYRYGSAPAAPYSDMNGWGPFARAVFWFDAYWTLCAGVLFCLTYLLWIRGPDTGWSLRRRTARLRFAGAVRPATALLLIGTIGTGAFIYYNTNILNEYIPSDEADRRAAEYERRYRRYIDLPQPRIVSVRTNVDIYPSEGRATIRGEYRLVNRSGVPIRAIHLSTSPRMRTVALELPPHRTVVDDRVLGYSIHELDQPLAPGAEAAFRFELAISNPGFVNGNADTSVVGNGTFFHVRQLPSLGYQRWRELGDPALRRRLGLPPPARMASIDDARARMNHDLASDADLVDFEAIVGTSPDQIALAPGDLEREWIERGRRYFRYRMAAPIPKFFSYLSGRYAVRRDEWNGIAIEVLHHPAHTFNVVRMIAAVKQTLAYMTANVSPYQHRHVRIVEVPRYVRRAVSFPNTIPFSESIGFIARLKDPDAIDYPFYVTAHEVAHQWWGYQVLGADVQGSGMLSESMAQYCALMVMQREYGAEQMRRFLRYELDAYLRGRGGELVEEMPLALVEDQPYIYYRKGALALYALQDAIGEDVLNGALRRYVESVRGQTGPYTVSRDLLAFVREVTPPEKQRFVDDLFESITLFDIRAREAVARRLPDGRYEVRIRGEARKLRADGEGNEQEVVIDDWVDVAVLGGDEEGRERVLYREKRRLTAPTVDVALVVDGEPRRAGLDPLNILVDRRPGDNVTAVSVQ
ncbi:MAG TPA: M1 family aminopeptidase [Vicinamibacterales bacterium]|nr:M1 family aminopeptidase [Vicinamibacterales bacterium]